MVELNTDFEVCFEACSEMEGLQRRMCRSRGGALGRGRMKHGRDAGMRLQRQLADRQLC